MKLYLLLIFCSLPFYCSFYAQETTEENTILKDHVMGRASSHYTASPLWVDKAVKKHPIDSVPGIRLYEVSFADTLTAYVQEINLTQVDLRLLQAELISATCERSSPELGLMDFFRDSLSYWSIYGSEAFSMINAAFFGNGSESAFPIKSDGILISAGYGNDEPLAKRCLMIDKGRADIVEYSNTSNSYSTVSNILGKTSNAIVGLHPIDADKKFSSTVGRSFVGLTAARSEIVFVFCSSKSTQRQALKVLMASFGCRQDKILMLDGGGSTQFVWRGAPMVHSSDHPDRKIPSVLATFPKKSP